MIYPEIIKIDNNALIHSGKHKGKHVFELTDQLYLLTLLKCEWTNHPMIKVWTVDRLDQLAILN